MIRFRQLFLLIFLLIYFLIMADLPLYGMSNAAYQKNAADNQSKSLKLSIDVKGANKFEKSTFEVEYTVGYGKDEFDTILAKGIFPLTLIKPDSSKEIDIIEASRIDYTKVLLVEYRVTLVDDKNKPRVICEGGNWNILESSLQVEKIIINIMYNETDDSLSCFQSFKYANDKSK